jgi:alcohol dehydrogenase
MQIPDYFKFFNKTRIISGRKALENIPYELKSMDAVKPLVVTDSRSVKDGVAKELVKAYADSGLVIGAIFDGAADYSSTKIAEQAAVLFRSRGCDSIIAIGSESSASAAKGVNLLVSNVADDLPEIDSLPDIMNLRPFIFIPTSDSTGRETSSECVIDGRIYRSPELMPDIAVLDSRMLKKRGSSEVVISALKAMAEAIEACTQEEANPINDSFAFASIQLISENLSGVIKGFCPGKSRLGLANGIAISGIVSSNAPEGLCSALAGELAKSAGGDKGLYSSILLPYILDYKLENTKSGVRGELLLPLAGIDRYCSVPEGERSRIGVDYLIEMIAGMNKYIPASLNELKIPHYILNNAAQALDARFAKQYGKGAVLKILEAAYEGTGGTK